jgi:hypothetical protein
MSMSLSETAGQGMTFVSRRTKEQRPRHAPETAARSSSDTGPNYRISPEILRISASISCDNSPNWRNLNILTSILAIDISFGGLPVRQIGYKKKKLGPGKSPPAGDRKMKSSLPVSPMWRQENILN